MTKPSALAVLAACVALSGCSAGLWDWLPGIYRIDIQQGNAITEEMVSQLQPGMTKRQVTYIMGTPLIQDPFHKDRWDYVYTMRRDSESPTRSLITLYFEKDQLTGLEGDYRPSDKPVIVTAPHSVIDIPRRELDETWWGHIKRWFSSD